jgi:predicted ATP-grasp superfamily ATP-dependent carboligase
MTSTWGVPAVVVGMRAVGLGVVRSLALGGCRRIVGVEAADCAGLPTRTRLCEVRFVEDLYAYGALRDELSAVARGMPGPKPVLFLTTDEHVGWACGGRDGEAIREYYSVMLPEEGVCREMLSKEGFARVAEERGYPVPRGVCADGEGLVGAVAERGLRYPLIAKPSVKTKAWARRFEEKALMVRSEGELEAVAEGMREVPGTVVVQEYVEGEDGRVCFCLCVAGEELGEPVTFAGRKLYQWPRGRGNSAVCEPIEAPELEAFARRFVGETGLEGLCSIEVKYGEGGGFQVIEPTVGRPDLQSYLATLNGVNLPWIAYLIGAGEVGEARRVAEESRVRRGRGRVWVYERAVYQLVRGREVRVRSLVPLVWRRKGYVYLSARDVGVMAGMVGRAASVALGAVGRRARGGK